MEEQLQRREYTEEEEIDFLYLIVVKEKKQIEIFKSYNISRSTIKARIANIKLTLPTVSYIDEKVLYDDLASIDPKLVKRLVKASLKPCTNKSISIDNTSVYSTLPPSISEVTPFGKLPPISKAFRESLNKSGVASPKKLSSILTEQKKDKGKRLPKCDNTMTSATTNVGGLRNILTTKEGTKKLPPIKKELSSSPKTKVRRVPVGNGRSPCHMISDDIPTALTAGKQVNYLAYDQSSTEDEASAEDEPATKA